MKIIVTHLVSLKNTCKIPKYLSAVKYRGKWNRLQFTTEENFGS